MLIKFKQISSALVLLFSVSAIAADGPGSSGGGGVLLTPAGPQLVDFYNLPAEAMEALNQKYAAQHPSRVTSPQQLDFGPRTLTDDPAANAVLDILKSWSELPYDAMGSALYNANGTRLRWNFVNQNLTAPPSYRPATLPAGEIQIAAAYSRTFRYRASELQININRGLWNQMNLVNQTGLMIHETLRHVQLGYGNPFNDEQLQKATVILMACRPRVRLSQYLFYTLNNNTAYAEQVIGSFEQLIAECGR